MRVMLFLSRFSTRFPKLIIFMVSVITAFFAYQFVRHAYVESDISKMLPTGFASIKANDYSKKNFSYNESLLVGIGSPDKGIMNPAVLRSIEQMVFEIKRLKTVKIVDSKLIGKKEAIELPIGIDTDDITSISGLEDAILDRETGAVVTGSVIKKLKKEMGIGFTKENAEWLPESDEDLNKIIPALEKHVLNDRVFRGNILSGDGKASTIMIPLINKWDYKQRYTSLELGTALDQDLLRRRYQGKTSTFPFTVYEQKIDGVLYDNVYIEQHSQRVADNLKAYLDEQLSPAYETNPQLAELLSGEMNRETFDEIIKITQGKDFFVGIPDLTTWDQFVAKLYDFTLEQIDPLSRENLEFQLPDVKNIYDMLTIYDKIREVLKQNAAEGVNTYVAGEPVLVSVMNRSVNNDMGVLIPIGLLVIILMLAISFKSIRGVVIPLITVTLSIIWSYGLMAAIGSAITTATSTVPIVLLAVGSAYGIHFLNRYNEDAKKSDDRGKVLRLSIRGVGIAVFMAGVTTISGFISLSTSEISMIRDFSLFSAFGISVALLLTLTLTPSLLCFWKLPSERKQNPEKDESGRTGIMDIALFSWASMVKSSPRKVTILFLAISAVCAVAMKDIAIEAGMVEQFKDDNPVKQSDRFIAKNLTGTGEVKLVFKFRDSVNLNNNWIQGELKERMNAFDKAWDEMVNREAGAEIGILTDFKKKLLKMSKDPVHNEEDLLHSITLMNDILNEEFVIEGTGDGLLEEDIDDEGMDALLDAGADSDDEVDLGGLGDLAEADEESDEQGTGVFSEFTGDQVAGLKDINRRLGESEENWESTGEMVLLVRNIKSTDKGQKMIKTWNQTQDLFAADIKQPYVLHKLEEMRAEMISLQTPKADLDGDLVDPTGFVMGPVDMVRKTYSVFYHDEDPAYKKIPDAELDNLGDPTLTNRGIIGVVLNQAQNSNRDTFNQMISPDLKEFQYSVMIKSSLSSFSELYIDELNRIIGEIFAEDDPYIASYSVGGMVPVVMELANSVADSQISSIGQAILLVFAVTFFIFRSGVGGLYSLIPLVFTILANFGMMIILGMKIDTATVMVASISIGIGVDYTIHFLERFKIQLKAGDEFDRAYFNTIRSVGKAIIINAVSVAAGFLVMLFSDMSATMALGVLMAGTMAYSSLAALTLLPAVIFVTKPKFLSKFSERNLASEPALQN